MQERWRMIREFPNYSISDAGQVRNEDTGRIMTRLSNQRGIPNVGLTRDRVLYKRSVTVLVAEAFLAKPEIESEVDVEREPFDTPINLDGDRFNNHVSNLMWRPLWFARKYFQQFNNTKIWLNREIERIETGEIFKNSWHAATTLGLIDYEILMAISRRTYVWPLYQTFAIVP
jgi:NUMOD4 motif